MKRLFTILLMAMVAVAPLKASADIVNQEAARAKAAKFLTSGVQTRTAPSLELVWDGESMVTRSTSEPAFFIFNRTDAPGFVIVAGDDAVSPILGYSTENNFGSGEMPANLRWWLEGVRSMILAARAEGQAPKINPNEKMGTPVCQLETADWNQEEPYNRDCPTYNGVRTMTGCVQTSAAIICKYNRWPDYATGTAPGYTTSKRNISVPGRTYGHTYNYDLMPNVYTYGNYTDEEANAVAQLMADIGVMTQADYNTSETGATTEALLQSFTSYLRYSKQASLEYRTGYSDTEWIALLKKELDADRPIVYGGSGSAGGHQFIIDGYTTDDLFGVNWGWSGSANGYYDINIMVPTDTDYDFASGQDAIINLIPDKEGTSEAFDKLVTGKGTGGYNGFQTSTSSYAVNQQFTAKFIAYNLGTTGYSGKLAVAHLDSDGNLKSLISKELTPSATIAVHYGETFSSVACTITENIKRGDIASAIYWERSGQKWERVRSYDGAPDHVVLMAAAPSAEDVAAATSIAYDKATKKMTIRSYEGATLQLTTEAGASAASATISSGVATLDCSKLSGKYNAAVIFEDSDPYTFTLVF